MPIDLAQITADVAAGIVTKAMPEVLERTDGVSVLYPGRVNGIHGESGCGKSFTALLAAAQQIRAGSHVVYVDFEDSPADLVRRLLDLGLTADEIVARFHYVRPETAFEGASEVFGQMIRDLDASLVVIDSTGEATSVEQLNPNADEDIAKWFAGVPRKIAAAGPAVLLIDHAPKAADGSLWPIGSQRKRAAINGAQYLQELVVPFAQGQDGSARLVCAKDRHGNFRSGERVAVLDVRTVNGGLSIVLEPAEAGSTALDRFRPTVYMQRVSEALEAAGAVLTFNGITDRVQGKRTVIARACDVLTAEGYVLKRAGARNSMEHILVKPFREGEPVESENESFSTGDRFRSLRGEPGTGLTTGSGNQSGTSGNQWNDPGTCVHGITVGARCSKCGGHAVAS